MRQYVGGVGHSQTVIDPVGKTSPTHFQFADWMIMTNPNQSAAMDMAQLMSLLQQSQQAAAQVQQPPIFTQQGYQGAAPGYNPHAPAPQYGNLGNPTVPPVPTAPIQKQSLSDLANQPNAANGPAIKLNAQTPVGFQVHARLVRDVTDGDVRPQLDMNTKQPIPGKSVLVLPVLDLVDNQNKSVFAAGQLLSALRAAMADQGYPDSVWCRRGDVVRITVASKGQNQFGTMSNRYDVVYAVHPSNQHLVRTGVTGAVTGTVPDEPPFTPDPVAQAVAEFEGTATPAANLTEQFSQPVVAATQATPAAPTALPAEALELLSKMGVKFPG